MRNLFGRPSILTLRPAPGSVARCASVFQGLFLATLCAACGSAPPPKAKAPAAEDAWANFDAESSSAERRSASSTADAPAAVNNSAAYSRARPPLLGARHDLQLSELEQASCKCLQIAYGKADRHEFSWAGAAPSLESDQWAMAFREAPCGEDDAQLSYRGFERSGADIVVRIESARAGRPRVTGAVIPIPAGRLIIQPHALSTAHGRSLEDGSKRCIVSHASSSIAGSSAAAVKTAPMLQPAAQSRALGPGREPRPNFDDQPPPAHLTRQP